VSRSRQAAAHEHGIELPTDGHDYLLKPTTGQEKA
jgi:hypothetical protein